MLSLMLCEVHTYATYTLMRFWSEEDPGREFLPQMLYTGHRPHLDCCVSSSCPPPSSSPTLCRNPPFLQGTQHSKPDY